MRPSDRYDQAHRHIRAAVAPALAVTGAVAVALAVAVAVAGPQAGRVPVPVTVASPLAQPVATPRPAVAAPFVQQAESLRRARGAIRAALGR